MNRIGVILNNIGSPSESTPEAVGHYLNEFLMDEEILNLPFLIRYPLVRWLIVPRRKKYSAQKYQKVWINNKSPLISISERLCEKVQDQLGTEYLVRLGMRYSDPSIQSCLDEFKKNQIEQIYFAPLYPQYAKATTFSAIKKIEKLKPSFKQFNQIKLMQPFFNQSEFIDLLSQKIASDWKTNDWQHILFSFHGLPESQVKKNQGCLIEKNCCERQIACDLNCYRAQCFATAGFIAEKLNLQQTQYTVCFQSRLGPARWIQPSSLNTVQKLASQGVKKVLVQSPSFVTDCLETLEEISIELKDEFIKQGGDDLKLVPCLNDDAEWAKVLADLIRHDLGTKA